MSLVIINLDFTNANTLGDQVETQVGEGRLGVKDGTQGPMNDVGFITNPGLKCDKSIFRELISIADNLMKQMGLKRSNCLELVRNFQDLQDQIQSCRLYVVIYLPPDFRVQSWSIRERSWPQEC